MADHDHTYKILFSHAEMVADLIRGFVHEEWGGDIDFSTLEEAGGAFLAEKPTCNLATVLFRLEKSLGVATANRVLTSLLVTLMVPEPGFLRQAFAAWFAKALTNRRQEVKSMLAENITEWTRQWKQEGLEQGRQEERQEALEELREVLLLKMEERFGEIPESVRYRVAALSSYKEIANLISRTATTSSLAAMGF